MSLSLRQKEILTGLFCILVFVGGAATGEIALRLISLSKFGMTAELNEPDQQQPEKSESGKFYKDPETGLRLPYPNQQLGQVRINNLGFRGPDTLPQKPDGTLRLAFLGSSTTYDANVAEGKNWPHLTATQFPQQLTGCSTDFINAGLPGYSTNHMSKYWESKVSRYAIDVVVLLPGDMTNDIQTAAKLAGFSGHSQQQSWLAKHSLLWQKIEKNIAIIQAQRAAYSSTGKFTPDIDALADVFEQRLNQAIDSLQAGDSYLVLPTISSRVRASMEKSEQVKAANSALFFMPYLSIPTLIEAQDRYNQVIRRVAKQRGIALIEGEDNIPADSQHFVDSRHFNTAGSQLMAKRIIKGLSASKSFAHFINERLPACQLASSSDQPIR
jgi:lysophospholipase L1-like esterase